LRSAIAMVLAAVCVAPAGRAQEDPWGDASGRANPPRERCTIRRAKASRRAGRLRGRPRMRGRSGEEHRRAGSGPQGGGEGGPLAAGARRGPARRNLGRAGPRRSGSARSLHRAGTGLDGAPLADPGARGSVSVKLPELLGISEEELRAKYDIPVELNDAVVAYIRFFQTDAREHFSKWLGRSTRYIPMMREVLEREPDSLDTVTWR